MPYRNWNNNYVKIENNNIASRFSLHNDKLRTDFIKNFHIDKTFIVPDPNSHEFVLNFLPAFLNKNWEVSTNCNLYEKESIKQIVNGDLSEYLYISKNNLAPSEKTIKITIDFLEKLDIKSLIYYARQDKKRSSNTIKTFNLYLSNSPNDMGDLVLKDGEFKKVTSNIFFASIPNEKERQYRFMTIEVLSVNMGNGVAICQFDVANQSIINKNNLLKSLTITNEDLLVSNVEKLKEDNKQKIVFTFKPFYYYGAVLNLEEHIVLSGQDDFFRKYIKVKVDEKNLSNLKLDYYEINSFTITSIPIVWTVPRQANIEDSFLLGYYLELGQPIYLDGFYLGLEFPIASNNKDGNRIFSRYYSGQTFDNYKLDSDGYFSTWPAVIGVSRKRGYLAVKEAFYNYINNLSSNYKFRIQYNPCFEYYDKIDALNLRGSFSQIDGGFSKYGIRPLDVYAIDTGWEDNQSFWKFNEKFPNEAYSNATQIQQFGSQVGLFMNIQGGYGHHADAFAKWLQAQPNNEFGTRNPKIRAINVGDRRYIKKMHELMLDYQSKFDISYWKICGMIHRPHVSKHNKEHCVVGGPENIYGIADAYERWLDIFASLKESKENGSCWINATVSFIPSPWLIKWVDNIWLQNAKTFNLTRTAKSKRLRLEFKNMFGSVIDQLITYRDGKYYEFYRSKQFQIPQCYIFSQDPILSKFIQYNSQDGMTISTRDFEKYLFMTAVKGSSLLDCYYSPALFDKAKWKVNAKVISWAEDNHHILKNSRIFGGDPNNLEVYGYCAWTEDEGIIALRNPSFRTKSYALAIDENIGVNENMKNMAIEVPLGAVNKQAENALYSFGDILTITLEPFDCYVFKFYAKNKGRLLMLARSGKKQNSVKVFFNKSQDRALLSDFVIGGFTPSNINKSNGGLEYTLLFNASFEKEKKYRLEYKKDTKFDFIYYPNRLIVDTYHFDKRAPIRELWAFSICIKAFVRSYEQLLLKQGDDFSIYIDKDGEVVFTLLDLKVRSITKQSIVKKVEDDILEETKVRHQVLNTILKGEIFVITAIRERSGAIRIYVNGSLSATSYLGCSLNRGFKADYMEIPHDIDGDIKRIAIYNDSLSSNEIKNIDATF